MKKIAEGYYEIKESSTVSEDVYCRMTIDKIDGECLDTHIDLSGSFVVAGNKRNEFCKELGNLIDRYRI